MRRDRHGRSHRADGDPRRRPPDGWRAHDAGRFARIVDEALTLLPAAVDEHAGKAELVLADVPADDTDPADVPLARFERTPGDRPDRLVVFRRPVESRATSRDELTEVLRIAVAEAVADELGLDLGEDWDDEDR